MNFKNYSQTQQNKIKKLAIFDFDQTIAKTPEKPYVSAEGSVAINNLRNEKKRLKIINSNPNSTNRQKEAAKLKVDNALKKVKDLLGGWDGSDWWGSDASLGDYHYRDMTVNDEVINAMKKEKADPNVRVLMLTGRRHVVATKVREVLRKQGLYGKRISDYPVDDEHPLENHSDAHEEYFNGDLQKQPDFPKTTDNKPSGNTWDHKSYVVKKSINPNIEVVETWDDREDHLDKWQKLGRELKSNYPNLKIFLIHKFNFSNN